MLKRRVVPANVLTPNSKLIRLSVELSKDGESAKIIVALEVDGELTGDMEATATAVDGHWHICRDDPAQKFCEWDGSTNTKTIRMIKNALNVAVEERRRPIRHAHEELVAAVA